MEKPQSKDWGFFIYGDSGGILLEQGIPMRQIARTSLRLNGPELCEGHEGSQLSQKSRSMSGIFAFYAL
jgi:hypothetical protein